MIPNFELDRKESGVFVLIPQRRRCRKKIPLDIDRHGGLLSRICLRRRLRMKRVLARSGSDGGCAKAGVKDLEAGDLTRKAMSGLSISGSGSPETSERSETGCGAAKENQVTEGEARGEKDSIGCNQFSHGSISVIGRRRKMEDAVTIAPGTVAGEFSFFAVYDGHGGAIVANACRDRLHTLLEEEIEIKKLKEPAAVGGGIEWEKVMAACFSKMDEEVCGSGSGETENAAEVSANSVGSTAVVVVVGKEEVVVANCGDSRAVLCRGGAAVPLSLDHKPDRPDERERVEAAGGRVINWNGYRVLGVLATSRSIGDNYLKPYVTSEPEVTVTRRIESDEFIIIATDGLWDVVSNETACDVVTKCLGGKIRRRDSDEICAKEAATVLAELAMAKGSKDNISVIVVELKNLSCRIS